MGTVVNSIRSVVREHRRAEVTSQRASRARYEARMKAQDTAEIRALEEGAVRAMKDYKTRILTTVQRAVKEGNIQYNLPVFLAPVGFLREKEVFSNPKVKKLVRLLQAEGLEVEHRPRLLCSQSKDVCGLCAIVPPSLLR